MLMKCRNVVIRLEIYTLNIGQRIIIHEKVGLLFEVLYWSQ